MGMPFWGRIDLSLSGCHCAMMSQVLFSPGPDGWFCFLMALEGF